MGFLIEVSGHKSPKHIRFWPSAEHEIEIQAKF
jgi:hypothetical protein